MFGLIGLKILYSFLKHLLELPEIVVPLEGNDAVIHFEFARGIVLIDHRDLHLVLHGLLLDCPVLGELATNRALVQTLADQVPEHANAHFLALGLCRLNGYEASAHGLGLLLPTRLLLRQQQLELVHNVLYNIIIASHYIEYLLVWTLFHRLRLDFQLSRFCFRRFWVVCLWTITSILVFIFVICFFIRISFLVSWWLRESEQIGLRTE